MNRTDTAEVYDERAELFALCSCGAGGIIGSVLCMNCGVNGSLFAGTYRVIGSVFMLNV